MVVSNSSARGYNAFFRPLPTSGINVVHKHTYRQNTHTSKITRDGKVGSAVKSIALVASAEDPCLVPVPHYGSQPSRTALPLPGDLTTIF